MMAGTHASRKSRTSFATVRPSDAADHYVLQVVVDEAERRR
jgi:hypothetical protein